MGINILYIRLKIYSFLDANCVAKYLAYLVFLLPALH